jgi:hypothetical protein
MLDEDTAIMPAYKKSSFDTLECCVCDMPVPPNKVNAGPIVYYRCDNCKTSWRIDENGDQTHYRPSKIFYEKLMKGIILMDKINTSSSKHGKFMSVTGRDSAHHGLDEIVATGCDIHIERMSEEEIEKLLVRLEFKQDGTGDMIKARQIIFALTAENKRLRDNEGKVWDEAKAAAAQTILSEKDVWHTITGNPCERHADMIRALKRKD